MLSLLGWCKPRRLGLGLCVVVSVVLLLVAPVMVRAVRPDSVAFVPPVLVPFIGEVSTPVPEPEGLQGKVVYIVYGRPNKHGEQTWGSLGVSRTAEESWALVWGMGVAISQEIGRVIDLYVLNPVYRSVNGVLADIYVEVALDLARENSGLVALCFNSIEDARATILRLETFLSAEQLACLSVALDIEHFPAGGSVDAQVLNQFAAWFAAKHAGWGDAPGLVILYTFTQPGSGKRGSIYRLEQLVQYYPEERVLVVPIFDGYGSARAKLVALGRLVRALPDVALVGVMEFRTRWGDKYDSATVRESFDTLDGAPVFFFASQ